MGKTNIDRSKVIFITIDWMKYYKGISEDDEPLGTGGDYQKDRKHEVYNFFNDNGTYYGYAPPKGKINLKRIKENAIKKNPDGYEYIENVLVVFNGSNQDRNGRRIRRIIGFYLNAKVFNKSYENPNPNRIIKASNKYASYSIIAESKNVYLFGENDRNLFLPSSKELGKGRGYGQHLLWYADTPECKNEREKIIDFIEKIVNKNESKYSEDK